MNAPAPWRAATASAVVPGLGQVSNGRRRVGFTLVALTSAFLLALIALVAVNGLTETLARLANPDVLLAILVANLVVFGVRAWSTADAWWDAGGSLLSIGLASLLLFVAIPHVVVGYIAWQSRSTLDQVFVSEPVAAAPTTTTKPSTTTTSPDPLVPANTIPIGASSSTSLPLGTDRMTILLLGGDAGPGRIGLRTDTMIVATIDTRTGEAALFGLPRNMGGFEFSNGQLYRSSEQGLLNEVYRYGTWYPERFGGIDPGASAVMDVASHMLQLPIDYFVLVDLIGFAQLIDAFGGVNIDVQRSITAPVFNRETGGHTNITIEAGPQHMDGDLALAFARSRTQTSEYDRMGRQRCLLTAFADQLNPFSALFNFEAILQSLEQNVTTDIPIDDVPTLIELAPKVSMETTLVIGFEDEYRKGYTATGLGIPDLEKIRYAVSLTLSDPERARIELGIPIASEACG